MRIAQLGWVGVLLLAAACSSSKDDSSGGPAGAAGAGGTGGAAGGGTGGSAGEGGSGGAGGSGGSGGTTSDAGSDADTDAGSDGGTEGGGVTPVGTPAACPKTKHGTIVILGDSISDNGSGEGLSDQQPFYRELLLKNDDTKYPTWMGFDLATCWGIDATTNVVKQSLGGAVATENSNDTTNHIFLNQVKKLPSDLPGPVLVIGTIGGNDVQAALPQVVLGNDVTKAINDFSTSLDDAFGELTSADRFGAGVKADVLITNVFDPSDGTGNFSFAGGAKCPGLLGLFPAGMQTDPLLKPWNDAMAASATKAGVVLLDLHATFHGHGAPSPDTWMHGDCIHPNTAGHEHIRELFWTALGSL